MDGPLNFAWRIDFPHVLSGVPSATLAGEFALINQAQPQQELAASSRAKVDSGFDLIVGNPPFVTARNPKKRELYRERWPRVAFQKYLLLSPFFELSFGLLRRNGQLGFIASNAFAKREFGRPLIEEFFPTVDLDGSITRQKSAAVGGRFVFQSTSYGPNLVLGYLLFDFGDLPRQSSAAALSPQQEIDDGKSHR